MLSKALGSEDNFHTARVKIYADAKQEADRLYDVARETPIRITEEMADIINRRGGREAQREMRKLQDEAGQEIVKKIEAGQVMALDDFDTLVKGYDQRVNTLFKSTVSNNKRLGSLTKNSREILKEAAYRQNPDYKIARKAWASDMAVNDAMDEGLKILNQDADFVAQRWAGYSDGEKMGYRLGVLRAIARKMGNKTDSADITKGIFDVPNKRTALLHAFGTRDNFADFMDFIKTEQKLFRNFSKATGNSATFRRLMQASHTGEQLAKLGGYVTTLMTATGLPPALGGFFAGKGYHALSDAATWRTANILANEEGRLLTGRSINEILHPQTLIGKSGLINTGLPTTAGAVQGGLLASGLPYPDKRYTQ